MHGLINRSLQSFLRDTNGDASWARAAVSAGMGTDPIEAMFATCDSVTQALIEAAARERDSPKETMLEDLGNYLVSHENAPSLRRLLRFSGETFTDFLHSLVDLPDRARLAVPDLSLPSLDVADLGGGHYLVRVAGPEPGYAAVLAGLIRAMADDYGALVFIESPLVPSGGGEDGRREISVSVLDGAYAEGRAFALADAMMRDGS